jgi:hypothetical protein
MEQRFQFVKAEDPQVEDDEYMVVGGKRPVSVQVCSPKGPYAVNEYGYDDPADEDTFWVKAHGLFPDLMSAMARAVEKADA